MFNYSISIIIPAYNAQNTIVQCLQSVLNQNFSEKFEIIVVDDGSTDKTAEIIKKFGDKVRYIYQKNAGPATARNAGAQASSAELLFFTDADCLPQKDWIAQTIKCFNDPSIAVVAGSYTVENPANWLAYGIQEEISFRHRHLMPKFSNSFGSYNFCVYRKIFWEVGGFDIAYRFASGEDNDLSYKIRKAGYKIFFTTESKVGHFHTEKIFKYLYEQYRHGFWRVKMYMDHPQMMKGDNYTFWKDIVETLVVFCMIGNLMIFLLFSQKIFLVILAWLLLGLIGLEIAFGFLIICSFIKGLFFASVMLLRSLFRSFGFLSGILFFPCVKLLKNLNK